jgi:opacity protein-like surface antigen
MKKILLLIIMILLFSLAAIAQDFPQTEIFGGYSLMKIGGKDIDNLLEAATASAPSGVTASRLFAKSFNASFVHNYNPFIGVEIAAQYSANNAMKFDGKIPQFEGDTIGYNARALVKVEDSSVLIGPKFAYRNNEIITPFAHLLAGVNYSKVTPSFIVNGIDATEQFSYETGIVKTSFVGGSVLIGGGLDVNISDSVSVRPIQCDFVMTQGPDFSSHNVRLSFGLVFRLGMK